MLEEKTQIENNQYIITVIEDSNIRTTRTKSI